MGIQNAADGAVMVQRVDQKSHVLAHIAVHIIGPGQKFRRLIDQVGGEDGIDDPFLIGLVELLQTVGEKSEGGCREDPAAFRRFNCRATSRILSRRRSCRPG